MSRINNQAPFPSTWSAAEIAEAIREHGIQLTTPEEQELGVYCYKAYGVYAMYVDGRPHVWFGTQGLVEMIACLYGVNVASLVQSSQIMRENVEKWKAQYVE